MEVDQVGDGERGTPAVMCSLKILIKNNKIKKNSIKTKAYHDQNKNVSDPKIYTKGFTQQYIINC